MEQTPIRRIVIAGGGTAGWMTAAALARTLGKILDITLVESEEIGTVGVGESTIPTIVTYHRLLEINEQAFMAATNATFKLGISFENWRDVGEDYIHSFGVTGKDHWTAGFQHFWLKGRERGLATEFGDYCLELRAAQENRFAHLPKQGMNYAFHIDASVYARFLRDFSERYGVRRVEGRIAEVRADRDAGRIRSLRLASGDEIEGDLFIDCTGFRALLIGQALGVGVEDWSHWLHCDSAVAVQTEAVGPAVPYTRVVAHGAGWRWRIPLQHRIGNGIVFGSRFMDDDTATRTLLEQIEGSPLAEPRLIRFKPCQRHQAWSGNCVAIGLSSGFLEPLESTSIHLIQRGILRLLQMFPGNGISPADVAEYNRQVAGEVEHIRDFLILHYHVTRRADTPFWRTCREMEIPASLRHRIDLFRETGRVFRAPGELFTESSWTQVMLGQGLVPEQRHPVADLMGDQELGGFLNGIRAGIERTLAQLPPHQTYVEQYCAAARPTP
ncbi:tryptophan halogenase family protein [Coralloluteibacterium stylophorae]|uniref:Tryptophan 7-halogenase n=1 Tax=Coralloluteibacterium stylophorae TaxID=1776034 RepID=A0A8J7VSI4_9GAMM|nr:tryptophan 7-halogenase [Coralloluteibacterium stylophorae]